MLSKVEAAAEAAKAQKGEAFLSPLTGEIPAFLTPEMRDWYSSETADRGQALGAVRAAFEEEVLDARGARGIFALGERDRARDQLLVDTHAFLKRHRTDNSVAYRDLEKLKERADETGQEYANMRAELGSRDPVMLNKKLYVSLLIGIGLAEGLLNFESFSSLKWASPAIATGMTILVALAIAGASHWHGTLIKQSEYYFGAHREDVSRRRAYKMLSLGTTALILALAAVFYARDTYLADLLNVNRTFGSTSDVNPLWVIGGSLLGNIIVYVVGIMIAYALHDSNPEFPEKKKELDNLEEELKTLQDRLDKARRRKAEELKAKYDQRCKAIDNIESRQKTSKNYRRNQECLAALQRQDKMIEAALNDFRTRLLGKLKSDVTYCFYNEEDEVVRLSAVQYQALPIKLKYGYVS